MKSDIIRCSWYQTNIIMILRQPWFSFTDLYVLAGTAISSGCLLKPLICSSGQESRGDWSFPDIIHLLLLWSSLLLNVNSVIFFCYWLFFVSSERRTALQAHWQHGAVAESHGVGGTPQGEGAAHTQTRCQINRLVIPHDFHSTQLHASCSQSSACCCGTQFFLSLFKVFS